MSAPDFSERAAAVEAQRRWGPEECICGHAHQSHDDYHGEEEAPDGTHTVRLGCSLCSCLDMTPPPLPQRQAHHLRALARRLARAAEDARALAAEPIAWPRPRAATELDRAAHALADWAAWCVAAAAELPVRRGDRQ